MTPSSPQCAYGVDFSGYSCTVVRARRKGGTIHFETVVSNKPPGDPTVAATATTLAAEQQSGRAIVSMAAPVQDSVIRSLTTPFTAEVKARAVLPSLLDVQLPFPLEQCASHFIVPEHPRGETIKAVAVAIPSERLSELLEDYRKAGFDAEIIDHEGIALWRLAVDRDTSPATAHLVVYLGADRTVAVAGRGREPSAAFSTRTAWCPGNDSAVGDRLAMRLRQFVAGALGLSGETRPALAVCGPLARQSAALLAGSLDIPAGNSRQLEHAESALARAIAASALAPDAWSVNLRTGTLEHPNLRRRRDQAARNLHTAVRTAAGLLLAASLGASALVERGHADLQSRVQVMAKELTGAPVVPRGQELFLAGQFAAGAEEQYRPFRAWLEPTAYPLFATLLNSANERSQKLETLSVRADAIVVRGSGTDWNDPEILSGPVRQAGWIVEIEREEAGLDERVHYTLRASR